VTNRTIEASPQLYARTGGALYLAIIVLADSQRGSFSLSLLFRGMSRRRLTTSWPRRRFGASASRATSSSSFLRPLLWIEYLLLRRQAKSGHPCGASQSHVARRRVRQQAVPSAINAHVDEHPLSERFRTAATTGSRGLGACLAYIAFNIALIFSALLPGEWLLIFRWVYLPISSAY